MKKSIGIIAVLLLSSVSLFASVPTKAIARETVRNLIKVEPLRTDLRIGISVDRSIKGKSFVTITDKNRNVIFEDYLTTKSAIEKVYNISELAYGDYTIKVTSNDLVLTKTIHVYDEGGKKTYFFFQE